LTPFDEGLSFKILYGIKKILFSFLYYNIKLKGYDSFEQLELFDEVAFRLINFFSKRFVFVPQIWEITIRQKLTSGRFSDSVPNGLSSPSGAPKKLVYIACKLSGGT